MKYNIYVLRKLLHKYIAPHSIELEEDFSQTREWV